MHYGDNSAGTDLPTFVAKWNLCPVFHPCSIRANIAIFALLYEIADFDFKSLQFPPQKKIHSGLHILVMRMLRLLALLAAVLLAMVPANAQQNQGAIEHFNRGAQFANAHDNARAAQEFQAAIHADPDFADAYFYLGMSLLAQATVDSTGHLKPAEGTIFAFQTYIGLAPGGTHSADAKKILGTLGVPTAEDPTGSAAPAVRQHEKQTLPNILPMLESAKSRKVSGSGYTVKHCNKNDYEDGSFDTGMACIQVAVSDPSQAELADERACIFGSRHLGVNPCGELGALYESRGNLAMAQAVYEQAPGCVNSEPYDFSEFPYDGTLLNESLPSGPHCLGGLWRVSSKQGDVATERLVVQALCDGYSVPDACRRFQNLGGQVDLAIATARYNENVSRHSEEVDNMVDRQNELNREASERRRESDAQFSASLNAIRNATGANDPNLIVNTANQQIAQITAIGAANDAARAAARQQALRQAAQQTQQEAIGITTRTTLQLAQKQGSTSGSPNSPVQIQFQPNVRPIGIAFSFSLRVGKYSSGDGAWGVGASPNWQTAIDSSGQACAAYSQHCGVGNGGRYDACKGTPTTKYAALATITDEEHTYYGTSVAADTLQSARSAALSMCNHAGCNLSMEFSDRLLRGRSPACRWRSRCSNTS